MAQYDGSIRIGTGIDVSGFKEGEKKIEAEARNLAKSVSSSISDIEKNIENLKNAQKNLLEAGGSEKSSKYQEYAKDIQRLQERLESLQNAQRKTEIKDSHFNQLKVDVEEYANSLKELQSQGQFFGDEDYDKVYVAWKNATDAVKEYQAQLNQQTAAGQAKAAEQAQKEADRQAAAQQKAEEQAEKALQKENARIQKQIENEAKLQAKEAERQAKIQAQQAEEERLAQIKAKATVSDQKIIDLLERRKQLLTEIKDLEKAGVGTGYKEYEDKNRELEKINGQIKDCKRNLDDVPKRFSKMRDSAKKAFDAISGGAKKSGGLFSTLASRFKGIMLTLLIFQWISKAFNAMIAGMKQGFENLAGYSNSYAQSVQSMKNAMSTLGNSFAAAFAPIVQMVIPWLNQLIGAMSTAVSYVGQFIAALTGASTFTRAKKIQDGYNKSLEGTAGAAKKAAGALAAFDDINVLQIDKGGDGGAEATVAQPKDMFEEVPIDKGIVDIIENIGTAFDNVIERMKPLFDWFSKLKDLFVDGFFDGLGASWKDRIDEIIADAKNIGKNLIEIFTDPAVVNSAKTMCEKIAYALGQIVGSIASIGITIAQNLVGGLDMYLEQNKEFLKQKLVSIFDITGDIALLIGEAFETFAYIFEAFGSENGQQLTANIIGIFVDAFLGVTELALKLARDILNIFIQPFTENKEAFRTALEGFLGTLSEVAGTIKQGIDDTFKKLNEVYDAHFKPFFDSIANGLSDTAGKFMKFWNGNVQPILNEWAVGFDVLWQEHIQPMIDNFIEMLGLLTDLLMVFWEEILKPFIDWIIENVLPELLPIIDGIVQGVMDMAGIIADIIDGVIDVFRGIIKFLIGVFTGDWDKAWKGVTDIFEAAKKILFKIWDAIKLMFEGIIKFIVGVFTGDWDRGWKGITDIFDNAKEMFSGIWDGIKKMFEGAIKFLTGVFTGDWEKAWEGITDIFEGVKTTIKSIVNGILGIIETMANGVVNAINTMIRALNALQFTFPDWIPEWGGKTFGLNLREISKVTIPRLATGAVIRGGNPFMAILGDQPRGQTNIEAPLATIKQAVREELSGLNIGNERVPVNINLNYDGETFARLSLSDILAEAGRQGYNVEVLGVT